MYLALRILVIISFSVSAFDGFAQNKAEVSVTGFFRAVEDKDTKSAALYLNEILQILTENPVIEGQNYYNNLLVKTIMLGLKNGIGGYTENGYAKQRTGGRILIVRNSEEWQGSEGLTKNSVKLHLDGSRSLVTLEYRDSQYISHNDTDRFVSRVSLTDEARIVWSQELTDLLVKILNIPVVHRDLSLAKDIRSVLALHSDTYIFDFRILGPGYLEIANRRPCDVLSSKLRSK